VHPRSDSFITGQDSSRDENANGMNGVSAPAKSGENTPVHPGGRA
jgi:hypothetical protein